jgi:glycolate oxidase iron-sulfur subunit
MPALPDPAPRAEPARPAAAGLMALAEQCVQCGLCLPHCPTYRLDQTESESPRGRIAYVKAVAGGRLAPTKAGDQHLDHCLGCRRCEPACPAGVEFGALLVQARSLQSARRPPRASLRVAGWLLAHPRWLGPLLSLYRHASPWLPARLRPGFPPPPPACALPPEPAGRPAAVALFTGCIAGTYESGARVSLARLLAAAGEAMTQPAGQGCCGAAAAHAGDAENAARLGRANRRAFSGESAVLCLASGCQDDLAQALAGQSEVQDALSHLDSLGDRLSFRPSRARVALHLPCSQRRQAAGEAALLRLLARVPGLQVVTLPDSGCCGAAGLHQLAEPERARALRAPLLTALAASGATELLSANIGCRLHLADGTTIPVRHPVEFLAEHLA